MDHDVDVRDRLDIDEYAISPVDALIAKMQIGKINQKDVHDVIALVKDVPLREIDDDLSIDVPYLADVCSRDWGLYHDITTNLGIVIARLDDYGLSDEEIARVYGRLAAMQEAVEEESKTFRWRLRASVGQRVAWRREIEETEGTQIIAPEWDWRRDLGIESSGRRDLGQKLRAARPGTEAPSGATWDRKFRASRLLGDWTT